MRGYQQRDTVPIEKESHGETHGRSCYIVLLASAATTWAPAPQDCACAAPDSFECVRLLLRIAGSFSVGSYTWGGKHQVTQITTSRCV
jgi:hypothetical protein